MQALALIHPDDRELIRARMDSKTIREGGSPTRRSSDAATATDAR